VGVGIEVQPECVVRNQSHAAGHQSEHSGQPCDGADRSLGLRQEHLCALPEPHARDQSHCARVTGTVRIGDLDIYEDAKPVEIRRRVGMVFQRPNPFPTMSIYDNVARG
jgi:energy-coupling factor transporter ATP-binding protein EcfA2